MINPLSEQERSINKVKPNCDQFSRSVKEAVNLPAMYSTRNTISFGCPRQDPLGGRPFYYSGFVGELTNAIVNLVKSRSLRHPLDNRQGD